MNQKHMPTQALQRHHSDAEIDVVEMLTVLARYKKYLIVVPLIVATVAALISFAIPNTYKATARLLPPQQAQSGAAALLSQLGGMAGAAAGAAGIKNPNEMYIGMLRSRTIGDKLIQHFNLKQVYDTKSQEKALKTLAEMTTIGAGKDGLITIEVEHPDQKTVAKLTNQYVQELIKLTNVLAVTEAAQRRVFFEQQLERSKDNLAKAEINLKQALDSRGVISVDGDSRAMVETVGRLRAQISAKEIQINSMRAFVTTTNPEFRRANEELSSLRGELSNLENGRGESAAAPGPATNKAGLENIKILRDVKYYQMLYELLAKQYEAARLDEAKETSVIQVLDAAVEPERKFKPKRAIIVMLSAFAGFFISIIWIFVSELKRRGVFQSRHVA
jgi:tyrosine-protein kinase Etk/Wzc